MKKGKLFVLPFLAMAIGTLSSCTKDDIKALQDKDNDLQSQIDGLKEEVAGLKNQITDLKTEMATKIQEVKDDYGAKIKAANDEITADKAALATLTSTYNTEKAALEAALRAEIKAVDDKYAPLVQALQDDVADLKAEDTRLAGLISDLESALGGDTSDLEAKINNVNTALEALKTALKDYDLTNPSVKGIADKVAAVDARVDALSSQAAADKAELSSDYNAKIDALSSTVSANYSHFENEIDNLQDQIDDLNDELAAKVLELQNDYNAKINALTERVAALEDVPVYTVTFDLNYDYFNGDVAQPIEIEVLKGDKLNEADLDPEVYTELDRPGNVLVQWNYEDTDREWAFFGYPVTQDMTLKAQWAPDSSEHQFDFANGFTFARETLDKNGHVRYRCSEHGDACYFETQEKAGLLYIEDLFTLTRSSVKYTAITAKVVQGRFYQGQEVTIQLANGLLKNCTIESIEMIGHAVDVAIAGDNVGLLFKDADLAKAELVKGGLVCKAGEAKLYGRGNECLFHLYSEDEQAMYPDLGISARHTPVFDNYRPILKHNNANRTIQIDVIDSDTEGMIKPGEDGIVKFEIPTVYQLTFFEKYDANFAKVNVYEGTNLIGYLDIDMREADMALLACGNTENTFVKPLYPDHSGDYAGSYYLPDDDQFFDDIDGWNALGGYPPFQWVIGYSKDPNSTNPEYEFGGYADSDVSLNVYFIWEYQATLIFDGVTNSFTYEDKGTSGMALTSELVQDSYFKTGNAGTKVTVYYSENVGDSYYDGYYTVDTFIDIIEVNGAQYLEEYEAKAGQEVTLYLRNIDESIMEKFLGLAFDTTITANISANKDNGGVNPDGQVLRSFTVRQYNYLPTMDQYAAPTRRLLGFSADPAATVATYAPGEYYRGTDTQLYAIWGEKIVSFAASRAFAVTGRGTVLVCDEMPADITVGMLFYIQLVDGTITTTICTGLYNPDTGRSIADSNKTVAAGTTNVGVMIRGIDLSKVDVGTFIWAQ